MESVPEKIWANTAIAGNQLDFTFVRHEPIMQGGAWICYQLYNETSQALINQLTIQNEALIENAFKTYKGNGNPNLPRFGMAMSAITSERDGRAASDALRKDYLERIAELEAELVTANETGLAFEEDAGQQRERVLELQTAVSEWATTRLGANTFKNGSGDKFYEAEMCLIEIAGLDAQS